MRAFHRSLPMSLLKAREAVMRNFLPHLREHGLTAQQWRVLRALEDRREAGGRGLEMTRLAEECFLLMPSLSRIVQNLERRSLVRRHAPRNDLRRSEIRLTEAGVRLVALMAPQSEERYTHITREFGSGKLELLYELLDELTGKLDAVARDRQQPSQPVMFEQES